MSKTKQSDDQTTALAVPEPASGSGELIATGGFVALQEGSEIREAMQANLSTGETIDEQDLVRIKTPSGGGTTWVWEDLSGEVEAKEISGLLVYIQPRGVLWPYEEPGELRPVLVTHDMVRAVRVGEDTGNIDPEELDRYRLPDGSYDWPRLPWNQFGSGKGGVGKRCKEQRILFVLREGDAWPVVIKAGPGSLKVVRQFIKRLPVPHWRAMVSLTLKREKSKGGIDYSQVMPRYLGAISREAGETVRGLYTAPLSHVATTLSVDNDYGETDD